MSNTGSRLSGQPAPALYRPLLTPAPREREAFLDHVERVFTLIGSPGRADVEDLRELAGLSYDRARDPAAAARQLAAILASGNRTRELRRITAPTLVVHGTKDRLVRPSGGRATARAIPGAGSEDRGDGTRPPAGLLAADPGRDRRARPAVAARRRGLAGRAAAA